MNTLIIYMLKTSVYLAGFYLVYYIFLSRDTFYGRNRSYILLSVAASFILPAITITVNDGGIFYFGKTLSEIVVTAEAKGIMTEPAESSGGIFIPSVLRIYAAGVILLSLKLILDILILFFMIVRNRREGTRIIFFKRHNTSGFSAFGYIFINSSAVSEERESIIKHEESHISRNHFLDILLIELAIILQWFNPFIYFFNRSLRALHEYQADDGCLKSGIPVSSYQSLLLNSLLQTKVFLTSNSFSNPSLIRKRMLMMTRARSKDISNIKLLAVIPVLLLILMVLSSFEMNRTNRDNTTEKAIDASYFEVAVPDLLKKYESTYTPPPPPPPPPAEKQESQISEKETVPEKITAVNDRKNEKVPDEIFTVVEEMPQFPGTETALMEFIYQNVSYPEKAKENSIQGRVIIRFAVMADGNVSNISVLKGVDPELDNEAIRVIGLLPQWKPGLQGGKPVNVWYSVPVTFTLN